MSDTEKEEYKEPTEGYQEPTEEYQGSTEGYQGSTEEHQEHQAETYEPQNFSSGNQEGNEPYYKETNVENNDIYKLKRLPDLQTVK